MEWYTGTGTTQGSICASQLQAATHSPASQWKRGRLLRLYGTASQVHTCISIFALFSVLPVQSSTYGSSRSHRAAVSLNAIHDGLYRGLGGLVSLSRLPASMSRRTYSETQAEDTELHSLVAARPAGVLTPAPGVCQDATRRPCCDTFRDCQGVVVSGPFHAAHRWGTPRDSPNPHQHRASTLRCLEV